MMSHYTYSHGTHFQGGDLYGILMEYLRILKNPSMDLIWGVIGPSGNLAATTNVLRFAANSGVITVSKHN